MKKFTKLFTLALLAMGLTSCLEDENIEEQKYGMINVDAFKVAELPSASESFSILIEDKPTSLDFVSVHLAANEPAQEDVHITLNIDQSAAMIAAYNTANDANLVQFPVDKYTLPAGLVVTIPKGSKDGFLKLNMNPKDLDPTAPYALGFTITSVDNSKYVISGNYNKTLVRVSAKNAFEADYHASGTFTHPTAGPRVIDRDKAVTTVSVTTSRIEVGDLAAAGYYMYVQVNADNSVTILPDPTAVTQDVFADGPNT